MKMSAIGARAGRQASRRVLRVECLENRRLLSVGTTALASTSASADSAFVAAHPAGAATTTTAPPTISKVVVSTTQRVITWNAAAATGVASSSLAIDGTAVTNQFGPYVAPPGVNYSGVFGGLSSGVHTYVITATDGIGRTSTVAGNFNVPGPTISRVVVSVAKGVISWNAAAIYGVASSSLAIDGAPVANQYGPFVAPPGVNFSGTFGSLSTGSHSYVITALDGFGNSTQFTGTFRVGPTISQVVVSQTQNVITWNAAALAGVASTSLTIDGAAIKHLAGPFIAPPGVNFAGSLGTLAAGNHTYVIAATDGAGRSTTLTGTFVVGPVISQVVVSTASNVITWNAAAAKGVVGSSITIDSQAVSKVQGPFVSPPGVSYSATFGTLSSGTHNYTITAIDGAGNTSTLSGTFSVGPVISNVVVSTTEGTITWNAAAVKGVASSTVTIDAGSVPMQGPTVVAPGLNFTGLFGILPAGSHTYLISAIDGAGVTTQLAGTFFVS